MTGHGPDVAELEGRERGRAEAAQDRRHDGLHVRKPLALSADRIALDHAQPDYDEAWGGFPKAKLPG